VIAAAFADINYTLSIDRVKQNWFGSVSAYYHEVSFGKLTVEGDIYGWYRLPYPEVHYGKSCLSINDAGCDGQDSAWQIAQDAIHLAGKDINFNNYDYFIFIHSGYGQESSGVKDDIWSVTWMGGMSIQTPSRTISVFSIVPELEAPGDVPNGVYCLEFGHDLGLPDLYNIYNGRTILGPWELMDKGSWNGDPPGSSPAHMTAWDKIQLHFISGTQLATVNLGATATITVDPTEIPSSAVHAIEIPVGSDAESSTPSHYYLVEVRSLTGFDSALPAAGVLITYVDNTAAVGKVHVIDGHPSTANLMDAVWNVGQTFEDSQNKLSVEITGKVAKSYQITVNRGGSPPPPPRPQTQNQTFVQLSIVSVTSQPTTIITANTTVTISIEISNQGTSTATNVPIQVMLDGKPFTNLQVASIGANSSTQASFVWISTLGSHVFQLTLDPNDTINEPSRANNVVTFNVYVGPTLGPILVVNIPSNLPTTGNVWVSINGIKYNMTSSRFQSWVPNGTVTLNIQPVVNSSEGVREVFSEWVDGSVSNPRQILITANTTLQAVYQTQYLLSVDPNGGTTTSGGWCRANSTVPVSATTPSNVIANTSRLVFNDWSGDISSTSSTLKLTLTKPYSLRADWTRQYYVTILSPTGLTTGSGWYNAGQLATISVQSTVQYSNGTRQLFTGWNSTQLGTTPTGQITVNAPTILQAAWKTQYLISVQSPYGAPKGSGWYDAGSTAYASVQPEIDYGNETRRVFTNWTGDLSGSSPSMSLIVNSPKTIDAQWLMQYQVTFKVTGIPNGTLLKLNVNNQYYDLSPSNYYQAWYATGSPINPSVNETVAQGFIVYKFTGWTTTEGATQGPLIVNAPETYTASYSNEMSLPPIPGYPIEAILMGILLGSVVLVSKRRRREAAH
jgi:M6 family metalloprotease-like protein